MFHKIVVFCLIGLGAAQISFTEDLDDRNIKKRFESSIAEKLTDEVKTEDSISICESYDCLQNAERISKSMKPSVNPCENFYEYACGNWIENNPIPPSRGIWNPRKMMASNTIKLLQGILEEKESTNVLMEKARIWYNSCMNIDALESRGFEAVTTILSETGGWPLTMNPGDWNENEHTWQKVDEFYSRVIGHNAFFSIEITPELGEDHSYLLSINYPKLPLSSKIDYDRHKMYSDRKYKHLIIEVGLTISKQIGSNVSRRQIEEDVVDFLELERQINAVKTKGLRWRKQQNIEELEKFLKTVRSKNHTSKINFLDTINNILGEANVEFNGTEPVMVETMGYLPTLIYILDQTPARTIVNFVHWSFISKIIDYTTERFRIMKFDVTKDFYGIHEIEPRSEMCAESVKMTHALANEFVKKYFTTPVKEAAMKLILSIQDELEKVIQESSWMDAAVKNESVEKVRGIIKLIGYPDWYDNETALLAEYKELSIGSQYFENELSYLKFNFKKTFQKLGQPFDFYGWLTTPLMINTFYLFISNSIVIPAAILQPPFFTPSQPDILNYGFVGFFIAHEIAHAFDSQGRYTDKEGGFSSWNQTTHEKYENKTICFIRQAIEMTKNEKKSKFREQQRIGFITQNENLADTLGLKILYGAYKETTKNNRQFKLPGLEYFTNDQLLFLSFANFWCENVTPEMQAFQEQDDKHSNAKYRVISSISNSKHFAEAFHCPVGSEMNPEEKCSVFE